MKLDAFIANAVIGIGASREDISLGPAGVLRAGSDWRRASS
jgi:hypothetical protein